jgi:streptogramin lyase
VRRLIPALLVLLALAPATASAAPTVSGEFPTGAGTLSAKPRHLTLGSDGNIWAVLEGGAGLARVTPAGAVTEFANANLTGSTTEGITTGPDGNLWVTATNKVVKISPGDPTAGTPTTINEIGSPQAITTGPDGNLWTGSDANLIKIPPGDPTTYKHYNGVLGVAQDIAAGGNGQIWVADRGGTKRIASFTTADPPVATYYNTDPLGGPYGVVAGPGTQMAFSDPLASPQTVGRITPGGSPLTTPTPDGIGDPHSAVFGNDGAYWFARFGTDDVLRLTLTGQVTTLPGLSASSGPRQIAKGPGDTLWVSEETALKIGRISGVSAPPGGGGGGGTTDTVPPGVSGVGMSDTTVVVGSAATPLRGTAADKTGTTIRYTLTEAATVSLRIDRRLKGRRVKKGKKRVCAKPTRKNRKKRKCTRFKRVGTLTRTSHAGQNKVKFTGRIGRKALKVGRYRLTITATDTAGNKSKAKRLSFRVVKPPKRKRR